MRYIAPAFFFTVLAASALELPCGVPTDGYLPAPPRVLIDEFNPKYTSEVYSMQAEAGEAILIRFINLEPADSTFKPRVLVRSPGAAAVPIRTTRAGGARFSSDPTSSGPVPPFSATNILGTTFAAEYALIDRGEYHIEVEATNIVPGAYRIVMVRLNRPCASAALSCGASSSGQVSGKLDVKTYQTTVISNDTVSFRWVKTGPFAPTNVPPSPNPLPPPAATNVQMFIFGPDGILMASATNDKLLAALQQGSSNRMSFDVKSPLSGSITAVVFDATNNTAAFSISASSLNGRCIDKPLICGTPIDTAIKTPASVDHNVISASAGDVYAVRVGRTDINTQFIPAAEVYDQTGKLITTIAATVTSPHAVGFGIFTAPTAGTYTVLTADASDGSRTGGYTVTLNRLNRPCTTNTLGCSSIAEGKLDGLLRTNTYTFAASANDSFLLRILNTGENRSFRPRLDVYDASGNIVQTTSTYDIARVNFTVPSDGTYTAVVGDGNDGAQPGTYTLSALRLNNPCTGTAIDCGKVLTGGIGGPLRVSTFTYRAAAGDSFGVRLLNSTGIVQPDLEIYDPTGQKVGSSISGNVRGLDVGRPLAGAYTIVALDSDKTPGQGDFSIELLRTRNACGTSPAQGLSVSGVVSGNAPFASYSIPVSAGDVLSVRSASFTSGFSALMEVYDQDGLRVDLGTYSINRRVPTSGTYTVLVSASNPRTAGAYALSWQLLNNPTTASSLLCGSTVAGALSSASAFRYYLAGLDANDSAKFLLTPSSDNFSPRMEVYDPVGNRLASAAGEIAQRVTRSGNYLVVLAPETANGETGTYSVSLQRPNNPCNAATLSCGQSLLRNVDVPGQMDAVSFTGATGDLTNIRLPVRSGNFSPFGELYNSSGALLRGFSTGTLNYLLPAEGKYTLFVRDRNGTGTGSYRVSLQTDPACAVDDKQAPTVSLVRPTGGEVIAGGTVFRIGWVSDDNVELASHEVRLSTDGGKTFPTVIARSLSGAAQVYDWSVPGNIAPSRTGVLQVVATDAAGNSQTATSDVLALIGSGFPENNSATVGYDGLSRVTDVTYSDGRTITYTWDAQGNLVRVAVSGQ